jgi:hypothetical protein
MGATKNPGQPPSVIAPGADAVQDSIARSIMVPKKMLEANLRAGSALLNFASQRMQAQAQFLARFLRCDNVEQAATMQKEFFEKMIGDYSGEMNELMQIARENSAFLATGTAEPPTSGKAG